MRVAVTGGSGVLGCALRDIRPRWLYTSRADNHDIRTYAGVSAVIRHCPEVVLHAAALTDHAHPNAAEIIETNIIGTQRLAESCKRYGIPLIYTSTHYVYAGEYGGYDELARPRPIGAYAMSKWAGERAVMALLPTDSLVVRGSWYTRETRLDHWARKGALVDAWCSREPVADAARKIVALVEAGVRGVVNIGGERRSFRDILVDEGYTSVAATRAEVNATWGLPYPFPADTSVNTAKFDALGLDWKGV